MELRSLAIVAASLSAAACVVEDETSDPDPRVASLAESTRIKDRVLVILCDDDTRDVQQELVPVVKYARARDGRSDRVWEVADTADCEKLAEAAPS